jgi:alanine-glyoxylate transaminase/serine-glyoxylate transaminase/serine-pyruvate transaminase
VNDIPAIRAAIDASGHDALLLVDAIASLCTMPFEQDGWGVDVAVTGSQKGLMMSPGLSFCAAGPRALEAHRQADLRTRYWDWTQREGPEHYQKYCGTPPEHLLFGLQKSLELLLHEGLDNVFERHRLLAGAVRRAIEVWSEGGAFEFNVLESNQRSDSTTTIRMHDGYEASALQTFCSDTCGVTLGRGIGDLQGEVFRIAHMGHINAPMILGTLGSVELALTALKMPHGTGGMDAAVQWLGQELG